jgi:hypothetical protein
MFAVTCGFVLKTKCKIDTRICCAPPGFFGGGHKYCDGAKRGHCIWKGVSVRIGNEMIDWTRDAAVLCRDFSAEVTKTVTLPFSSAVFVNTKMDLGN